MARTWDPCNWTTRSVIKLLNFFSYSCTSHKAIFFIILQVPLVVTCCQISFILFLLTIIVQAAFISLAHARPRLSIASCIISSLSPRQIDHLSWHDSKFSPLIYLLWSILEATSCLIKTCLPSRVSLSARSISCVICLRVAFNIAWDTDWCWCIHHILDVTTILAAESTFKRSFDPIDSVWLASFNWPIIDSIYTRGRTHNPSVLSLGCLSKASLVYCMLPFGCDFLSFYNSHRLRVSTYIWSLNLAVANWG